jgi:hypothetical protein
MIVQGTPPRVRLTREQQAKFLSLLPLIVRQADIAFRNKDAESREELTAEVVANAYVCFVRLVQLGRESLAFGTPLGTYAVRQTKAGRKVGTKSNANDVGSPYAQVVKCIHVERLDHRDKETGEWREILLECPGVGPAETAAARIDFADWLGSLSRRNRSIATTLATGESTGVTAKRFNVSSGRISQLRRELKASWETFQGEVPTGPAVT